MKKLWNLTYLPLAVLIAGAVGTLLRLWLLTAGRDAGGLLIAGHPAQILLVILSLGIFVLLLLSTRHLVQGDKFSFNFPSSLPRFLGALAAALGILVTSVVQLAAKGDSLHTASALLGLAAAGALAYAGFLNLRNQQPNLLLHGLVCVYLMVLLICQYRVWCSEPQIQTYCYPLLATVCTMLACYHNAMFDGDWGSRRWFTVFHLLAGFFCCISVVGDDMPLFYLAIGIWMFTDQCNLRPMSYSPKQER